MSFQVTYSSSRPKSLPKRCASRSLQRPNQLIQTVRFHSRDAEKLNLSRHHEYQKLHLNRHVPLPNIPSANLVGHRPMVLAKMDLLVLPLSKVQSRADLFCKLNLHHLLIADHRASDSKELDKTLTFALLDIHRHCLVHKRCHWQLISP